MIWPFILSYVGDASDKERTWKCEAVGITNSEVFAERRDAAIEGCRDRVKAGLKEMGLELIEVEL